MLAFLDSPFLWLALSLFCLFVVCLELPPQTVKKSGKKRSFASRLGAMGRRGRGLFIPGVLLFISAIAGFIDLLLD